MSKFKITFENAFVKANSRDLDVVYDLCQEAFLEHTRKYTTSIIAELMPPVIPDDCVDFVSCEVSIDDSGRDLTVLMEVDEQFYYQVVPNDTEWKEDKYIADESTFSILEEDFFDNGYLEEYCFHSPHINSIADLRVAVVVRSIGNVVREAFEDIFEDEGEGCLSATLFVG